MKVDKVKYTAQYEAGRKVAEWIGIDASPDVGETADEAFKAAQDKVNQWHNESNPGLHFDVGFGPSAVIQNKEIIPFDPEFEQLKSDLEKCEWRQDADKLLSSTVFGYNIEAKKIVNSKPLKND